MKSPRVSAVICTHDPRPDLLDQTLAGLRAQTLASDEWELLLIDNASASPLAGRVDLSWHPRARIVREDQLGLTHARLRGFSESQGDIIVCIDDDNDLDASYLQEVVKALSADASLGAIGGKSIARFEREPPDWFQKLGLNLACRDLGDRPIYAQWADLSVERQRSYPECAPVGAGMALRRNALRTYADTAALDSGRTSLGRKGSNLASGEDNDIIMSILATGWRVAYLPQLKLFHAIPAARLTRDYLARHSHASNRTWVQVLNMHGIRPWTPIPPWSVPLRKARAFLALRAWQDDPSYILWRGACGLFEGRSQISK
ncbi:MAG: glycosyltransferase [Hyphomicrobium sp.]